MASGTEIIVKVHVDNEATLYRFDNVKKAASYIRSEHKNDPIEYVMEIEKDAFGVSRGFDRKEDFEKAWLALEYERLEEEWEDLPCGRENDHFTSRGSLDSYLNSAEGPCFTGAKVSRGVDLIAAE